MQCQRDGKGVYLQGTETSPPRYAGGSSPEDVSYLKNFEKANIEIEKIYAFDINPVANCVYKLNFPSVEIVQRNIEALSLKYFEKLNADVWTMSPPCQPYTRQGNQLGSADPRSKSFLFLVDLLGKIEKKPEFIILENVAGFEKSDSRKLFLTQLCKHNYTFEEFILNPLQFGYPNSRTRYYLLASRVQNRPLKYSSFSLSPKFIYEIPGVSMVPPSKKLDSDLERSEILLEDLNFEKETWVEGFSHKISEFTDNLSEGEFKKYALPKKKLDSHGYVFDVVMPTSRRSCCFTKGYYHYNEGTGSVLQISGIVGVDDQTPENTRYFTEYEIARLLGFPSTFTFENATSENSNDKNCSVVTLKQRYRLLGNSLSVTVVSELFKYLFRK
ncbi:hypothetical protein BB560_001323 [Smittium megazygosporum]|uniref:tRNA (cytosine(38)-C(5))-methyltransferase n=1 Tax=Smittium megazygosporum TaxID=133381 RepID=A0A2T9ZHU2_9FUNG|nr:hypothetical protein BB560_001323 [Smittium megazygosporum]